MTFFKRSVPGFTISTPDKLLFRILGSLLSDIVTSRSVVDPPLRVKNQVRRINEDIASSNIHVIFPVVPGKKVNSVPLAGEMIPPKQHRKLKITMIRCFSG